MVSEVHGWVTETFGWFLILVVAGFLMYTFWLMLGRFNHVVLGPDGCKPDYSFGSWLAMLFSAGMGIGLLFYGVAEPLLHFASPPYGQAETIQAARMAMNVTYFHWGLHAWAIYGLMGLSLAYFHFRKGLPLSLRSVFYPLLKEKIHGPWGHVIDVTAVLGTLFGVATSLGFGAKQVNSGMHDVFGLEISAEVQVGLIAIITLFATASVVMGLDAGIKRLSEFNIICATLFLIFVFLAGPTVWILNNFVQSTGHFLQNAIGTMFYTESYVETGWQASWTVFYWAWWISWSPFVGLFIARISKGRTIREFLASVLIVPSLLSFFWFSTFGGTALYFQMHGKADFIAMAQHNVPGVLFEFLKHFPLSNIIGILAIIVIVSFFVTSSDSGSFVVDMLASGGNPNPPLSQRIYWAVLEGVIAGALLLGGGLKALQTAAILTALPLAVALVFLCVSLYNWLSQEPLEEEYYRRFGPRKG